MAKEIKKEEVKKEEVKVIKPESTENIISNSGNVTFTEA